MQHSIRTVAALREACRQGYRPKYLFFWGHQPRRDGIIGKECLSQWWEAGFNIDEVHYLTAEHYMMAEKARFFRDLETRDKIIKAPHPGAAKKLGRQVRGFDEMQWRAARFEIVVRANREKFSQNDPIRAFLLGTKARVLVEASPVDRVWGIGLAADDDGASRPEQWRGLNLLGFALMEVREQLQGEDGDESR